MKFTIVMAYYENGGMLDRHMQEWSEYDEEHKKHIKAIIVDDGSPNDPAVSHIKDVGFPINLYRIKQDIPWNQNGARNLGMTHVKKGWVLLTDMDHLLPKEQVQNILNNEWNERSVYKPLRAKPDGSSYKRHPNTYLITRKVYWKLGGFDEAYSGYYGSDSTFRRHLKRTSRLSETDFFHVVLYGRDDIPDASTNPERYGRKGSKYHLVKHKVLRQRRKESPPPIKPLNFDWEKVI
jgi:hypothetical protein